MTDSMKFGPGWLRNMSADNTNPSLLSGGNGGVGGSANTNNSSTMNSNIGRNSQHSAFGGFISNVNSTSYVPATRSIFPEFRYGREEMLSLFDKSCKLPDILPAFKKIFIENVQYPLALTPSNDEELIPQVPSVVTQRPSWMQRSPVGFSGSTRGTARGGSSDRGRMRGKSTYHTMYQRPTAMFGDDDLRSVPSMKVDRGWPERNGAGDSLGGIGGGSIGSGSIVNSDWNGTPTSSPRKEFSSHPRNMENWRRSRIEDGSDVALTSGPGNADGWRGGSNSTNNNFTTTHRWGRSTSWRDDDISTSGVADSGYTGGSGITMQRSYSTITTLNERGSGYVNNNTSILKPQSSSSYMGGSTNTQSSGQMLNSLNTGSARNSQWNSASVVNSNGSEIDDNLPEWAMETPSGGGGTFDASGAFHGSEVINENLVRGSRKDQQSERKKSTSSSGSSIQNVEIFKHDENTENATLRVSASIESDSKNNISDSSGRSRTETPIDSNLEDLRFKHLQDSPSKTLIDIADDEQKLIVNQKSTIEDIRTTKVTQPYSDQQSLEDYLNENISDTVVKGSRQASGMNYYNTVSSSSEKLAFKSNAANSSGVHRDMSDRMREVADDMIEKLIMDDDTISIGNSSSCIESKTNVTESSVIAANITIASCPGNNLHGSHNFVAPGVVALLKQTVPHQVVQGPVSVSPALTPTLNDGNTVHKGLQLYGGVDHSTIQHNHLQQQQQLSTATNIVAVSRLPHTLNSTAAPNDLWYYRDPQSKVQGPFTAIEMTEWYRAGYFNENLYVRRLCDAHFRSLGELIKLCNDNMPFTHSHLIPMSLENIHLPNSGTRQPEKLLYNLKQHLQSNEQHEEVKGSDFLSGSVKNMHPIDMSQVYFQMLHQQEMLLINELSKNDCFQQLTPSEKEAVVRQKLQMSSLPEYLNSATDLNNLNSSDGNQQYDVLAECAKKDRIFSNGTNPSGANNVQQQPQSSPFIETDNFLLNSQQHQLQAQFSSGPYSNVLPPSDDGSAANKIGCVGDDSAGNDVLNGLNLRMFLPSRSANCRQIQRIKPQDYINTSNSGEFLDQQPLLGVNAATTALLQNNAIVHPWLPQLGGSAPVAAQQQPLINLEQSSQQENVTQTQNHQWASGLLVGIPMAVMSSSELSNSTACKEANVSGTVAMLQQQSQQQRKMPSSMWDLPTHEQAQTEQDQQQSTIMSFENGQIKEDSLQQQSSQSIDEVYKKKDLSGGVIKQKQLINAPNQLPHQIQTPAISTSAALSVKPQKDNSAEKYQSISNKRSNKQQTMTNNKSGKDENSMCRKNEGDRRRDVVEDKRRQKEEKKRQIEDEKRRQQQLEEEKRRHMLEEKERQQQIQAQRRKAMMDSSSNGSGGVSVAESSCSIHNVKQNKEQQLVQSSIAPWSTQTTAAAFKSGPCFAEIQRAERRERRADQQRQLELLEKKMRATAAAAEANDSMLKWNASPVPVKSFAEIQAEEAKHLANEQLEMQRRKEQEQHQAVLAVASLSGANSNVANVNSISAIWSGTKVWGTNVTASFWEEPVKFNVAVAVTGSNVNIATTAATIVAATFANSNGGNSSNISNNSKHLGHQKIHSSASTTLPSNTGPQQQQSAIISATRNLRKSQTVSVMQNAGTHNSRKNNQQPQVNLVKMSGGNNKAQQQKNGSNGDNNDKKSSIKSQHNNTNTSACISSSNVVGYKRDDFENEFTVWCTKSLSNMNTKVDVPTFVTFLQDLESPYEVKDYVRIYLGETKECAEFAKQFLERRSKYKNLRRAQNAHNDDMCKPAPAITPSGNDSFDNKGKQKKVKKNKMTKLDARVLGFSVTAAEGRTNVGDRAYIDAP